MATDVIGCHHERWDGNGYPWGHAGTAIPLTARIFAVADAYDAMTNDRPYRQARSPESALTEIRAGAGSHFDPAVVDTFVSRWPFDPMRPSPRPVSSRRSFSAGRGPPVHLGRTGTSQRLPIPCRGGLHRFRSLCSVIDQCFSKTTRNGVEACPMEERVAPRRCGGAQPRAARPRCQRTVATASRDHVAVEQGLTHGRVRRCRRMVLHGVSSFHFQLTETPAPGGCLKIIRSANLSMPRQITDHMDSPEALGARLREATASGGPAARRYFLSGLLDRLHLADRVRRPGAVAPGRAATGDCRRGQRAVARPRRRSGRAGGRAATA